MSDPISPLIDELIENPGPDIQRLLQEALKPFTPDELALSLESLPLAKRVIAWHHIAQELRLDVLVALRGEARLLLLRNLPSDELPSLFEDLEAEDLLELAESLPESTIDLALSRMDLRQRQYYEVAQRYAEHQIGRWMNNHVLVVSQNMRVAEALRLLRRQAPKHTEVLYLVNRTGRWVGCVRITQLLTVLPHTSVGELQEESFPSLDAEANMYEAAELVASSGYNALPVLNNEGVLLGRVDMSTAVELLHEQAERQRMALAGLAEDADLFAPAKRSARTRALWLGINLLTALVASWFIGLFGHSIEKVVALAVLMPVVASMGGIAGSQTLTLVVRGLALGQVHKSNLGALFDKELRVGAINGVLWALVIGYVAWLWFGSLLLGLVIGIAVVVNIITAALFGVILPILLDRMRIDPALSGSVILTTVTDIVGFVAFLGLGTLLLV
ncbi:MAG TPA: magnesium transporter [Cellvibrionaceae bacterium]